MEELQADAKELPTRVQHLFDENIEAVNEYYTDLAKRGETLVDRIRRQQSTKATVTSAKTTSTKAKTTKTQTTKATATAAKKTASNAAQATTDAASKVGD